MATTNDEIRDQDYEAAFNDQTAAPAGGDEFAAAFGDGAPAGGDSGGMNLESEASKEGVAPDAAADAAETAGGAEGTPAAVVVVAEADGNAASEAAANDAAAKEAKAATDEHNADAKVNKQPVKTTGEAEAAAQSGKDAAAAPADAGESDPYDLSDVPPEDLQKAKSWVGRLKKMEADLKAKNVPAAKPAATAPAADEGGDQQAGDAIEQAAQQAAAEGDTEKAQTVAEVADQVKSGEITPQEAMQMLSADFGDDFVRMIEVVARHVAGGEATKAVGERIGRLEQDTQGVIDHLKNSAQRAHYQAIYDAHPDFMQVHEDPGFAQFVAASGKQDVVDNGSAAQINDLMAAFKASKQAPAAQAGQASPAQDAVAAAQKAAPAAVDQAAADAAEGVRSQGLRLPEKPGKSNDDFKSAWESF